MTAAGLAKNAKDDVEAIAKAAQQMKIMLGQINSVQMAAREMGNAAKGKLAGAAHATTGGTGTGQILQTRVGQSQVKLDELAKVLAHAAAMCEGIQSHASGVQDDIQNWIHTLRS